MNTPKGYRFAAIEANLHYSGRADLGLIVSESPATAAGVFTTNRFQAAPVLVAKESLEQSGTAQAVLINAGSANACTGEEGVTNCKRTLQMLSTACSVPVESILPASTGVIGPQFIMEKWEQAIPELAKALGSGTPESFSRAIMTTDTFPKLVSRTVSIDEKPVTILGIAKGAGMICPNMATMLGVVLTDAGIDGAKWQSLFNHAVQESFNAVTVDGDTSTNDCVFGLANGASGVTVTEATLPVLQEAVVALMRELAYLLVQDGEGATKVMRIRVSGAATPADAENVARTVGHSPLVKTAMYGKDANWGRIVAAIGRSGAAFDTEAVTVSLCGLTLFHNGQPAAADFDAVLAPYLKEREIPVDIVLGNGTGTYELLASDLTHEYISINADYRS